MDALPYKAIYLDNNATTPVDEAVIEAMTDALRSGWGNPSSLHAFGEEAAMRVERARGAVARLVGARDPSEIVFTSGGTESINTALHLALADAAPGAAVLTSATEHSAVIAPLVARDARAAKGGGDGLDLDTAPVDEHGAIDVGYVLERIAPGLALVTLHHANNETGVALDDADVRAIAERCRDAGVPFHLDAVQTPGKRPLDAAALGVDLLSISAHKFHGPKGVGALYVRSDRTGSGAFDAKSSLIAGGPQEAERRGGTQNVPGIVGMGRAAELALAHVRDIAACERVRARRDRLERGLVERIDGARVNGAGATRLDNTASIELPCADGEILLASLAAEGLAVSSGAACSSRTRGPSRVLLAMGLGAERASRSFRFSLSRLTTDDEIELTLALVPRVVDELRALDA